MTDVYSSSRLLELVPLLSERLGGHRDDPFVPDVVVVPSMGVRDFLTEHLIGPGENRAVLANVQFVFAGEFSAKALGLAEEEDVWAPSKLRWAILDVLMAHGGAIGGHGAPRFAASGQKLKYATTVAQLFDRYGVQRPELIASWANGEPEAAGGPWAWQFDLWRVLRERLGESPPERIRNAHAHPPDIATGRRFTIVGLDLFSASRIELLRRLAATNDVAVFALEPLAMPDQFAELARSTASPISRSRVDVVSLTGGLARTMGRLAVESGVLLRQAFGRPTNVERNFARSRLGAMQQMLASGADSVVLDERAAREASIDRSLQFHLCHGATRQVEVLRDAILHLLASDSSLGLRDVVVACTDLDAFAPLITPVFQQVGLPVVVDRPADSAAGVSAVVAAVLTCVGGRCDAAQFLDLLSIDIVRERYRIDADDLEIIGAVASRLEVRWGLDAADRRRSEIDEASDGTTVRSAMDRVLLGALMDAPDEPVGEASIVPFSDLNGQASTAMAKSARVLADLVHLSGRVDEAERGAIEWFEVIDDLTSTFLPESGELPGMRELRNAREELRWAAEAAPSAVLTRTEFRNLVEESLSRGRAGSSQWTDAVRVRSVSHLRGVTSRVIAVLGLDEARLRTARLDGDDILQQDPRIGERDVRAEERYAILSLVMGASDAFVVVADGVSATTNERVPPCSILRDLAEASRDEVLAGGVEAPHPSDDPLEGHPCVRSHPRQAFDAENFRAVPAVGGETGTGPWSFDVRTKSMLESQGSLADHDPRTIVIDRLGAGSVAAEPRVLDDLVRAVARPSDVFARTALEARLPGSVSVPSVDLDLWPDPLQEAVLGREMLDAALSGRDLDDWKSARARCGGLPPGRLAATFWSGVEPTVMDLAGRANLALPVHKARVTFSLDDLRFDDMIETRGGVFFDVAFVRWHARSRVRSWFALAALTMMDPSVKWQASVVRRAASSDKARSTGRDLTMESFVLSGADEHERRTSAESVLRFAQMVLDLAERSCVPLFERSSWSLVSGPPSTVETDFASDMATAANRWIYGQCTVADLRTIPEVLPAPNLEPGDFPAQRFARTLIRTWDRTAVVVDGESA